MRVTATATRTGITVSEDGREARRLDADLKVSWKGYRGVNTDEAEMLLEEQGLGVRTWIWNGKKRHFVTLLVAL